MDSHVSAIAGRLSLRPPQRRSLEILDRMTEIAPPRKDADVQAALAAIQAEFPSVTDFEREFPSVCFALATGVGKRLMARRRTAVVRCTSGGLRQVLEDWCEKPEDAR